MRHLTAYLAQHVWAYTFTFEIHGAATVWRKPVKKAHQSGLACAVGADERPEITLFDAQVYAVQDASLAVVNADVTQFGQARGHGFAFMACNCATLRRNRLK